MIKLVSKLVLATDAINSDALTSFAFKIDVGVWLGVLVGEFVGLFVGVSVDV